MPISTISQTISTIPEAGHRGVDVQTTFVNKQEDFQDHLQGTTVSELNALKTQINTTVAGMNDAVTNVNTKASEADADALSANNSASVATTKAGEASTSASQASTSATKASQWADAAYNVEVEAGKYSAKHWATVAQSAAVGEDTKGANIASATTISIGTVGLGDYIHITGTTTITSFGTAGQAGIRRTLIFDGALTVTHNATSLICTGGTNITTVAGTVIEVVAETTANWRVVSITHPNISMAELGYLDGVISNIQTQLNNKFTTASATETAQGLIELATTAETQAGTDDTRAITPLKLFNSLKGSNQSLLTNGYQKLHGGLIIQWGQVSVASGSETTVTLPISYATQVLQIFATRNVSGIPSSAIEVHASPISTTQIKLGYYNTGGNSANIMWLTIGY